MAILGGISLGARLLLLPLRTSSFPLCKPAAPWQQRPLMPTSLFAGLCLLGSATRLLDSSCAQQAPCERRLWAQMSKVRVVCTIPGAHLGRPRILMWPDRTCQHVGAEEARPKDNTNNDNNDLYAGLASMLVQRCRGAGLQPKAGSAQLPAQVQGGCPCAMDAALLDGAPAVRPPAVHPRSNKLRTYSKLHSGPTFQLSCAGNEVKLPGGAYFKLHRRSAAVSHGESASMQASDSDLAQALQIAAPLWAQQIPPVSQFRFAEPKVQKQ
ncbi:unnamed protein product, partial [Polarella glacialis]